MIYTTDEKITSVKDKSLLALDFCKRLRGAKDCNEAGGRRNPLNACTHHRTQRLKLFL